MYEYRCKVVRVIDGDTVDVDIDLGFGVWLHKERVRLYGIDTPMPEFEFSQLSTILMGMLGLGGLRSYEKMKGVHRDK